MASPLKNWLFFAIIVRLISAITHSTWYYPDEWFQSVEFANLIARGFATYSQEVDFHLRNLSWPAILTLPLNVAYFLSPDWIWLRFFSFQLFVGLLDLGILWGWWQLLRPYPRHLQQIALALLLLPWFTVHDSIRPSGEHISSVATWVCLGMVARGWMLPAGIAAVAIAAFKYPAGLISAGIGIALVLRSVSSRDWKSLWRFSAGTLFGLVIFGAADWAIYGKPWESLWMYSLYNLFSGASHITFGEQGAGEYWKWFSYRWLPLFPVLVLLLGTSVRGFWVGARRLEPWAFAFFFYLIPHLLIRHKEGRFLWNAETLWIWAGFVGFAGLYPALIQWRRSVHWAVALTLVVNGALLVKELWGSSLRMDHSYFEMNRHLKENPNVCAVVSVRTASSLMLSWKESTLVPSPSFAYASFDKNSPSLEELARKPLYWAQNRAECDPGASVLMHLHRPDLKPGESGCELLSSALLKYLPKSKWIWASEKRLVSGPWYRCPATILDRVPEHKVENALATEFPKISELPALDSHAYYFSRKQRCEHLCF